jgi:acyl dehydratase
LETVGLGMYFEDLPVGRRFRTIGRTITECDLMNYVNCLGLVEVLFTDAEFREQESDIKGRIVPGMLAHGFAEGLLIQATLQRTAFAFLEVNLRMLKPVYVGDTIHVEVEVTEARYSKSRPGRGIIRSLNRIVRQDGEAVIEYAPVRMMKCRSAAHG